METKLAVAKVMAQFELRIDEQQHAWKTPADVIDAARAYLTLGFPGGAHLIMRPRVPPAAVAAA